MLDSHRLRVFRSVVASGSVQAAATNLGYTPSAVSQQIAALARETGLTLFERVGRGLRPTPSGLALAAQADAILARLGEAESVVADLRSGRTGSLSLSYFASAGAMWLPTVVRGLVGEFPDVRLRLMLLESVPDDPTRRADVQLAVSRPQFSAGPGFTVRHLRDDPYLVALPAGHLLADRAEIELVELATDRWVDNDASGGWCRQVLVEACRAAGFHPPFLVEAQDYPTALAFVAAGIGITVLPELGAHQLPAGVVAVPVVRPRPVRTIVALVRDAVAHTPAARAAVAALTRVARTGQTGTERGPSVVPSPEPSPEPSVKPSTEAATASR